MDPCECWIVQLSLTGNILTLWYFHCCNLRIQFQINTAGGAVVAVQSNGICKRRSIQLHTQPWNSIWNSNWFASLVICSICIHSSKCCEIEINCIGPNLSACGSQFQFLAFAKYLNNNAIVYWLFLFQPNW